MDEEFDEALATKYSELKFGIEGDQPTRGPEPCTAGGRALI